MTVVACAHGPTPRPTVAMEPPRASVPPPDPVGTRISDADRLVADATRELGLGHLNRARELFDQSIEGYLTAPGGAYSDPRLAEGYRRTLETIHVRELEALAAGDGFTEAGSDPAPIDEVADLPMPEGPANPETRARAEEAVQSTSGDFQVELNDRVLACIDIYTGRLNDWFTAALSRGQRYLPFIRDVFAQEGIPQDLAYAALVESGFKPTAYSRAKARGVWQFISATGKRYGLAQDWWVDERSDPEKATRAAARYLKDLHAMFDDWNLALAAYNAGEGKILRGLARYKSSDYWELTKTRAIRAETKNYVPLIHAAIVLAKSPERYGITVEPEPETPFEVTKVQGAVDLRVIAECLSSPVEDLQRLNPVLRRLATPAGRAFDLRVPDGSAASLQPCLEKLPPEKRVTFKTYVVRRGQTLATIARATGSRTKDIAEANHLNLRRRLAVGTELIIPITPAKAGLRAAQGPSRPAGTASSQGLAKVEHRIRSGDTLSTIAARYGATVRAIQSWNNLQGSRIAVGDKLTIFTDRRF